MAKLERRYYIPTHLHPSMRFDIYTDGTVVMFVYDVEVARKKMARTFNADIFRAFSDELARYGIGIAPTGEIGRLREELKALKKEVSKLRREIKSLKGR